MFVRWLVIVLTLLGAIPVRICTCGAAHHHHAAPVPKPPCGHDHSRNSDSPSAVPLDPAGHHDDDCHFVKPRPIMSLALQFDVADAPPPDGLASAIVEPVPAAPARGYSLRDFHPPPDRPLFLTHSVLLI